MLKLELVSKTFHAGTVNERRALDDLSLDVNDGDFITVIGGTAAGKSTLLNIVSGVYEADEGRLVLDGKDITDMPEHKRASYFGRVFQDPMMGTCASMEIQENLALAYRRGKGNGLGWSVSKKHKEEFVEKLAKLGLGLETRLTTKVGLLSGGQRQALTLFMAALVRPKVLLLDEHTAALDPKTAKTVLELTERVTTEDNLTTLMITHNMHDAIRYGNRLIMMHEGKVIYDVAGEEKKVLSVDDLLKKFEQRAGEALVNDKMLLTE